MTDYEMHEPECSGTTDEDRESPRREDFDTGDRSEIAGHFVLSGSGFPPGNVTDPKVPLVDPDGTLDENALQTAHGGSHSVEAIDGLDEDTESGVEEILEELVEREFDRCLGE